MTGVSTIEDVARKAGVSVATVSRALRGLPHVSPSTRARVQQIADQLDYRANPHASRLAARRSGTIGVALPIVNSWFYGNILAGIEAAVSGDQLDMHLLTVDGPEAMKRFVSDLPGLAKKVDGLVVVDLFLYDDMWEALADSGMAVATVGVDTGLFDAVLIDNLGSARMAADHLLALGHRRLAFIGGGVDESLEFESAPLRRQGLMEALDAVDGELTELAGGFSVEGGCEAMAELLGGTDPPTAVFCASDEMAIGALMATRQAGLEVPRHLSVVGFDDHAVAAAVDLTTIHQPVSGMAARAADMVLERVGGQSHGPRRAVLETELIVRGSTGSPPPRD